MTLDHALVVSVFRSFGNGANYFSKITCLLVVHVVTASYATQWFSAFSVMCLLVNSLSILCQNSCTPWSTFEYPKGYACPHLRTTGIRNYLTNVSYAVVAFAR